MSEPLYERRAGSGPPLLFVHGLGVSSRYWANALRELSRDFDCRAPDLPGYGRSPKPPRALDTRQLAGVVLGLIDEPPVVVANSYGCQVAVDAARLAPARIRALVLAGPTYDRRASLKQHAARLVLDATREPPGLLLAELVDYVRMGPRRLAETARFMRDDAIDAQPVDAPVLVVRGSRDPIAPQAWASHVAASLAGRLAVVDGAAHAVHWTHASTLRRLVLGFLEERG